jgi:RHS repeat-associated protein
MRCYLLFPAAMLLWGMVSVILGHPSGPAGARANAVDAAGRRQTEEGVASHFGNPFLFTGREYDAETGLYYYRGRYYSPALGRFISTDPVGYSAGDPNLYRYVRDNPAGRTDPRGTHPIIDLQGDPEEANSWWCCSGPTYASFMDHVNGTVCNSHQIADAEGYCDSKGYDVCSCTAHREGTGFWFNCKKRKKQERPKGPCEFYLAWCEWGNKRPPGDKGCGWKRNAPCGECYTECLDKGKWPFKKCPMGQNGPTWRGPGDSVWPTPGEY